MNIEVPSCLKRLSKGYRNAIQKAIGKSERITLITYIQVCATFLLPLEPSRTKKTRKEFSVINEQTNFLIKNNIEVEVKLSSKYKS